MKRQIEIRAHHLLCLPRFYGGGYNKEFGSNLKNICMKIRNKPNLKIKVVRWCDAVCEKCPYKKGGVCKKTPKLNKYILGQDDKVFSKLKVKKGGIYKARDIFNRSIENITSENLKEICKGCVFLRNCLKVRINKSFKRDLNKN